MKIDTRATNIAMLRAAGHSAGKAVEIAIDAERGDPHALAWIDKVTAEHASHVRLTNA